MNTIHSPADLAAFLFWILACILLSGLLVFIAASVVAFIYGAVMIPKRKKGAVKRQG